jgi:biotin carboxylase
MDTLLILGARRMQLPAIRAAKAMGLRVVVADPRPDAPGFSMADAGAICDLADEEQCLRLADRHRIRGVMTLASDYPVPMAARICEHLSLPGITPEVAARATNKRLMRQALGDHGVPCLVEEFMEGPEFSVEAVTFKQRTHVVAITDKTTSGHPYWVELGHNQPSRWSRGDVETLAEVARKSAAALALDWAASHTEIRLTPSGPRVMEIGARLAGGHIASHLVPMSTGVDIIKAAIHLAVGEEPDLRPRHTRGVAIQFLTAPPGLLRGMHGLHDARGVKGVESVEMYARVGDLIAPLVDSTGRIGHVIAAGHDPDEAIKRADETRQLISFETEPVAFGGEMARTLA